VSLIVEIVEGRRNPRRPFFRRPEFVDARTNIPAAFSSRIQEISGKPKWKLATAGFCSSSIVSIALSVTKLA
jgi:hypothetical protein